MANVPELTKEDTAKILNKLRTLLPNKVSMVTLPTSRFINGVCIHHILTSSTFRLASIVEAGIRLGLV